ncbi:MBL fold metallo-hydrolase [Arcobacter sp. FWKO B]|uniref:MBL fold metallo-hydrolase n=1 Tax=Arcobacter sp. FWKO B TaxID=2593672 RepID=UPI0018A3C304|nr:MBL fold metallo-hydrolase [Arcobacter sp. FWKO B]QOG11563.1 MBL fold metallo-hydrolase [Arcobacter sp. FWKO B]
MTIKSMPMGMYQTNCYIVDSDNKQVIIDPGVDAVPWIIKNVSNPIAILNTHGHFDHVWSNKELKEKLNIPIYIPKDDSFMLQNDPFGQNIPKTTADVLVNGDEKFNIDGFEFEYILFAGHTPGCSVIKIGDSIFSGDFIFRGSIGRVDFPYSNPDDMKKSIKKILSWELASKDYIIYPGHGDKTTLKNEINSLKNWLHYI